MSPYNPHWAQYFQNLISLGPVWLNMAPPPRFSGRRSPALEDRVVGHTPLEPCGNSRGRPCHEGMCHGSDFSGWIQCHAYHPQMVGLGFTTLSGTWFLQQVVKVFHIGIFHCTICCLQWKNTLNDHSMNQIGCTRGLALRTVAKLAIEPAGSRGRRYPVHCSGECLCDLAMSWDKIIINNHKYTVK